MAAIVLSKIIMPETGRPETLGMQIESYRGKESSIMESIINGIARRNPLIK